MKERLDVVGKGLKPGRTTLVATTGVNFTRLQLNWLGLGEKLTSIEWEGRTLAIPPLEEPASGST